MATAPESCGRCGVRRSTVRAWAMTPAHSRAATALKQAHEDEYREYLEAERAAALDEFEADWREHVAGRCP